jgi:serine/threonine protein kinase
MVRLLQLLVSVCQAIAYATRGVIHRDIKPENIILGKFGEVVVLDQGLAKTVGLADEDDESLDGTPRNDSRQQSLVGANSRGCCPVLPRIWGARAGLPSWGSSTIEPMCTASGQLCS